MKVTIYLSFSTLVLLSGCAPQYIPNVINAPMHDGKGDVELNLSAGTSGVDFQGSGAITDHLGVMINSSFYDGTSDSNLNFHKHSFVEIGAGYFLDTGVFHADIYGGFGLGTVQGYYSNQYWQDYADVALSRIFVQPTIALTSKVADFGISTRLVWLSLNQDNLRNSGFFLEPALTLKLGYEFLKIQTQFGLSVPYNHEIAFDYQPFMFTVGIQLSIGKILKAGSVTN